MRVVTVRFQALALCVAALGLACGGDPTTDPLAPVGLELGLTPSRDTLFITDTLTGAETVQLVVTASTQDGGVPVPAGRVFESQDPSVATVDSSGLVHAQAVGTADIVVRVNGVRAHSTIVVLHPTSRVLVVPAIADILQDNAFTSSDTTRVHAQAYGADGAPLHGVRYTFTSSDSTVATVDATGKVTALKTGLTTITATANGLTGTAVVHVARATRSLSLSSAADSIFVDNPIAPRDTAVILPIAKDSLGAVRSGVVYTFSSSNPAVATVNPAGVITAKGLGAATISAVGADLVTSATVSVLSLAKSVTLAAASPDWLVGDTIPLHASAMGWHGAALTGRNYTYAEQGTGATVDTTGHAVLSTTGSATFTATTAFTTSNGLVLNAFPREFIGGAVGSISSGGDATCGLLPLNRVYCFGTAPLIGVSRDTSCFTDLPNQPNPRPCTLVPLRISGNLQLDYVSVGDSVACATDLQHHVYCWGDETYGEVGNGISHAATSALPALVQGPLTGTATFVQVSAGQAHACGIDPSGIAYCWGKDSTFQLGGNDGRHRVNSSTPTPVLPGGSLRFVAISAGGAHTCALATDGTAYCWGSNHDGQLGTGTVGDSTDAPTAVAAPGVAFVAISSGARHTCALTASQQVYCWGANNFGQAGQTGGAAQVTTPTLVGGGFSAVSAGGAHTCALRSGVAYCWGQNDYGQLGQGPGTSGAPAFTVAPTAVHQGTLSFSTISAGSRTTCAVAADGAYCWGSSVLGAVGSQVQAVGIPYPVKTAIPE